MFLKRLSILASMLVAACVPSQYRVVPTYGALTQSQAELVAWRAAVKANTKAAYRAFIRAYPNSRYVPLATSRISTAVTTKPVAVKIVPKAGTKLQTGKPGVY